MSTTLSRDSKVTDPSVQNAVGLSVIIPTFREAENLKVLIPRLFEAVSAESYSCEVIIVDDNSNDGTTAVCEEFADKYPVWLAVRANDRGLSSAVVHGLNLAKGEIVAVMDADCSHPPEALPLLVRAIQDKAEMVIGSRYVRGSSVAESWGMLRWLNSRAATLLAWPLTGLSDPMAGFFAMRRELFTQNAHRLNPIGYKIGLELVVKCNCRSVEEVPIHFENRLHGESKLTLAEQLRYLQHLGRLYRFRYYGLTTAIQFAVAGSLGMVLDLLMVVMLLGVVSFPVARASGIVAAMLQNFVVNRFWTFADAKPAPLALQLGVFAGACGIGALINWVVSTTLYFSIPVMHSLPLIPAIAGVLCGFASNYCLSRHIVFRREESV